MAVKKKSEKRIKKEAFWYRIQGLATKYKNVLFVNPDNVSSLQISKLRKKLREVGAVMLMGKNTLMKAALQDAKREPQPDDEDYEIRKNTYKADSATQIDKICNLLKGNVNLIFSNGDLGQIKQILDDEVRPSPAKPGMIAPGDVTVPAGSTGLDPKQTSYFQIFQIQTKIVKAQIEIVAPKQVVFTGMKIGNSEAQLLDKLKIYPFSYKMNVVKVLQDGSLFDAKVLDLSTDSILAKFKAATKLQASLSLGAGYPTTASAPHSLINGFKNLAAVCASSGYEFKEAKALLDAAKNAPAAGPATTAAVAAAPVEEEKKEEVEDVDMGGLFGDDDDY